MIPDVLTIVLFKCTAEVIEDFFPVHQICKENVLLELMRPTGDSNCEFYTSLEEVNKITDFKNREVGKVLVYRLAHYWSKDWEHPLQPIALFREKSEKYLVTKPKSIRTQQK